MTRRPGRARRFRRLAVLATAALAGPAIAVLAGVAGPSPAAAQAYPGQLVRIVIPFSAGSQSDILGRAYADKLAGMWKRDVIVENKPGLAGTAGAANARPDGYTLLLVSNGHALIESLNSNLTFDPIKDFVGIAKIAVAPGIMVVPPGTGVKTLKDLIEAAKAKPGTLNYASAGLGSASSIGVELMKVQAGINLVHIPYRGTPEANTSIMRGDTALYMTFFSAGGDMILADRLHAIAVTTARRLAILPDVPTMQEAGVHDLEVDSWHAMFVLAKAPKPIIDKLNHALNGSVREPDIREKLLQQGSEGVGGTPEALAKIVNNELPKWAKLAKEANLRAD